MSINVTTGSEHSTSTPTRRSKGPLGYNLPVTPFDPNEGKFLPLNDVSARPLIEHAVVVAENLSGLICRLDDEEVVTVFKPPELIGFMGGEIEPPYEVGTSVFLGKTDTIHFDINAIGRRKALLRLYNSSPEDIPANSVAEILDVATDNDILYYKVTKPTAANLSQVVIVPDIIESGQFGGGVAPTEEKSRSVVRIENDPAVGEEVGTVEDSWVMDGGGTGFLFLGSSGGLGPIRPTGGSGLPQLYRPVGNIIDNKIPVMATDIYGVTSGEVISLNLMRG